MAPTLPSLPRSMDGNTRKLLGASLVSPEGTRCPSSTNSRFSSRSNSVVSTTSQFPSMPADTSSNSSSSSRSSSSGCVRRSNLGHKSLAYNAARDLRSFSQSRRRPSVDLRDQAASEATRAAKFSAVPMEELLLDTQGGNGRRSKRDAEQEIYRRKRVQIAKDVEDKHEQEIQRRQQKDQQEWLWKTMEEQQDAIRAVAEHDRLENEREDQQRSQEEQRQLQIEAENAHLRQLRQPRTCDACEGTGKCASCSGSGCITVTYLSSTVSGDSNGFRGQTCSGCNACGGRKDGAELHGLDVLKGRGSCAACRGHGRKWLREDEVERAMQQRSNE